MTVVSSVKDLEALTLTIVNEFDAGVDRVWQLWEDPRQLERWWGPPTWPATFTDFDFTVGGEARYHMTGPEGEKAHGWWRFLAIGRPASLEIEDGFADANGEPDLSQPSGRMRVSVEDLGGGRTRMTIASHNDTVEQLQELIEMGMEEGMKEALGQIDAMLAE
ncbi:MULTISPECIES: SRPBCC domain-containing protein [Arthrobacter]|uniref:SRPBCC domain-containing protein n=2 Tax=Arthrobacter TaxID=1663 RepID=A0ABU9KP87_9MICC|nr:SRPBCC domain-containing protein [Arthrobacter sp. YJM1]MDP5228726.1 SRPBCC domain-containing protein [Arthrobacter sp. YJM1]